MGAVLDGSSNGSTSSNEEKCADVFADDVKTEVKDEPLPIAESEDTLLINPDLVKEEEQLRIKNENKDLAEEAKLKTEEDDLTPQQRYKKLCDLLSKSKFYSNFLLEKMEKEDEESKKLKKKNLAGRKTKATEEEPVVKLNGKRPRTNNAEE